MVAARHRYMTGVVKEGPPCEMYCIIYSGDERIWKQLVAWASNPLLSFDWQDVIRVTTEIERSREGSPEGKELEA